MRRTGDGTGWEGGAKEHEPTWSNSIKNAFAPMELSVSLVALQYGQ
jgi:hypothetical protein